MRKGFENNRGGDDFREKLGRGAIGRSEDDVGGDPFASVFLKGGGDGRISTGPVGDQERDIFFAEGGLHFGSGKGDALVDLAGQAPGRGEIDEYDPPCRQLAVNLFFRPGKSAGRMASGFWFRGCFEDQSGDRASEENEPESRPTKKGRRGVRTLGFPVLEKSRRQENETEQDQGSSMGSQKSEGHPNQPENGGEHGERENFFEGVHPRAWLRQEREEKREKRKEKDRQGKTEGEGGKDEESAEGGKGKSGGEGHAHERCSARGGDGDGEESGSKSPGPSMSGPFCGETGKEDGKLKNPQKVEGESKEEGKEEPDHGGGLELEPPTQCLTGSPKNDQKPC